MSSAPNKQRKFVTSTSVLALALAVTVLAGCSSMNNGAPLQTASTAPMTRAAALTEAQSLNAEFQKNPGNTGNALRFAKSLDIIGSKKEGVGVLAATADRNPGDSDVVGAYGKSLLGVGRFAEATKILTRARKLNPKDWSVVSALGLAYDQLDQHSEARKYYAEAAELAPGEPSILNNMGLSYALDKDLVSAERVLRKAAKMKRSDPRTRQNLALVVGLQGRFEEAKKIARMDLPKEQAEENVAYLKSMLSEPNAWSQLAKIDNPKPAKNKRRAKSVAAAAPARKPVTTGATPKNPLRLGPVEPMGGPLILAEVAPLKPAIAPLQRLPRPMITGPGTE